MSTTIAAEVRHDVMERAMDALLDNEAQARLGYDPDPPINSAIEFIACARGFVAETAEYDLPSEVERLLRLTSRAIEGADRMVGTMIELNGRERQHERHIAGRAEGISARLYSTADRLKLNHRRLAADLRDVLLTIGQADDPGRPNPPELQTLLARRAWDAMRAQIPDETLTSRTLARELGRPAAAVLRGLLHREEAR